MALTSLKPYILKAYFQWITDNDLTPYLLVDTESGDLQVPIDFVHDGQIILNISPSAVRVFSLSNDSVDFNARFNGRPFAIHVPMGCISAIYAKENSQGIVFPEEEYDSDVDDGDPPAPNEPGKPTLTIVK